MDNKARIVIADDHTLFRNGLKLILAELEDTEVVADVSNGRELIDIVKALLPELVILDINMPLLNGVEACKVLLSRNPDLKILVVSMYGEEQYYNAVIELGVKGFILKDADNADLKNAVRSILEGRTYFSQELLLKIIHNRQVQPNLQLTGREREILELLCQGLNSGEIAERLFLSERTVESHRASLLAKTGCKNSLSLVIYAFKNNLVELKR